MVSLTSLWLPIVVSAVAIFFLSFIVHMVLPFHRTDYNNLPAQDDVMDALRRFNVRPGDYVVPKPNEPAHMRSKEYQEKLNRGPVFMATVLPTGMRGMGAQLGQWFLFCVVVSLFSGYMASGALPAGAEYLRVSQIASTTAFLGYAMARWADTIWSKRSVSAQIKTTIDGIL